MKQLISSLVVALTFVMAGVSTAQAAAVTLDFTGTITALIDPLGLTAYGNGQTISGKLTIGPLNDSPTHTSILGTTYTAAATFDFTPILENGSATIDTQDSPGLGYFGIYFQATNSQFLFDFTVSNPTNVALHSLSDLPRDLPGILNYLGGTLLSSYAIIAGGPDAAHQFSLAFNPTSVSLRVATTPVPAALLLFVTALGGLGFAARRKSLEASPGIISQA